MTFRLKDKNGEYFGLQTSYVVHGDGIRTTLLLGTLPILRALELEGLPPALGLEWEVRFADLDGRLRLVRTYNTGLNDEIWFDSAEFFGKPVHGERITGSVQLRVTAVVYSDDPKKSPLPNRKELNGVLTISRAGSFITGVHLYHGHSLFSGGFCVKHYVKALVRKIAWLGRSAYKRKLWPDDALGACVIRSGSPGGGMGVAILHNNNPYPGVTAFFECRSDSDSFARRALSALKSNATFKLNFPLDSSASSIQGARFDHLLLVEPPLGVSRILQGEEWPDGRLALDHTYFQQPSHSRWGKTAKVRFFDRTILSESILGPSNPWPCIQSSNVQSSIALFNQFRPESECSFDLHVFSEAGKLILAKSPWVRLKPFGFAVKSVSAELSAAGIAHFQGTYLVSHSRFSAAETLPARLHAQAIYIFSDGTWNAVQSDSSIWSSPRVPVPAIENLSPAKIRRRQLWYAPVQENDQIETILSLANLSYSLEYEKPQTLLLTYCHGLSQVEQREVVLPAFGACQVPVASLFSPKLFEKSPGTTERGSITIYPKSGKTYCASVMFRDRGTGNFFIEHVLPIPKFPHER